MHSRSVEPGSVRWRLPSTAPALGVVTAPSPPPRGERVRSTLRRVGAHVVNVISGVVGDDVAGRLVRRGVVRLAGADVPRSTHLLGDTYFSRAANLHTGERCLVNRRCYLDLHASITLRDDVVIGHGTSIITSRHRLGSARRRAGSVEGVQVVIDSGAWVGANATILPGVTVGSGAVVAAGAVVTDDVPPNAVVAGMPARVIRWLDRPNGTKAGV